jgi:undecaprenyl diphosphate synthase
VAERPLIEDLRERVRARPVPRHVAVIMDGNGRWAEARGLERVAGHREGSASVRAVSREARRIGIEALTLYAFSAQNWLRPPSEVAALWNLLHEFLESERLEILENGIRLNAIGEVERIPAFVRRRLQDVMDASARNDRMILTLALSYDGREDIVRAARLAAEGRGKLDQRSLAAELSTADLPELDLLIRTSGERRISNFLLWQSAYAELYFSDLLWPDFRELELLQAIAEYQGRERRFGKTGAQVRGA